MTEVPERPDRLSKTSEDALDHTNAYRGVPRQRRDCWCGHAKADHTDFDGCRECGDPHPFSTDETTWQR
jgi:hypothetical protein